MGFDRYLTEASRKVDLDRAFGLRPVPKASHPAVRLKAKSELGVFFQIWPGFVAHPVEGDRARGVRGEGHWILNKIGKLRSERI